MAALMFPPPDERTVPLSVHVAVGPDLWSGV
jgi:hypothetical protein